MEMKITMVVIPCIGFLLFLYIKPPNITHEKQESFIVHVLKSQKPVTFMTHHHWYTSLLNSLPSSPHPTRILYVYNHTFHGFSARLTPTQAAALQNLPGLILSVMPEQIYHIQTTRSPDFLELNHVSGLWPNSNYGDNVIIGILDTGIWPWHRSFSDDGLSPVPTDWRGSCDLQFPASSCNKKLIGARAFYSGYEASFGPINELLESKSPKDTNGHGTHVASTAAGAAVQCAGLYGYAVGEARGIATKSRIAAYKVCWLEDCSDVDILAAMDQAVADGVDIISISLGANKSHYYDDPIAIGALGAVQRGILVSCAAGNSGPREFTVDNTAPWILTVGASTIDRHFPADVILGDGRTHGGISIFNINQLGPLPLVYAGDYGDEFCSPGRLFSRVQGKIVLCTRDENYDVLKGIEVERAGGAGMILASTDFSGPSATVDAHILPATMVDQTAGEMILNYIQSEPAPSATISFNGSRIGPSPQAPQVAPFSSRGPSVITPEIMKPDVIAPGVNILAAWSGDNSPTELNVDPRRVEFNVVSGTSMACPHVSGLAAMLRKVYPHWSPAAIKSALMTTAYNVDNTGRNIIDFATGKESTPFEHGSGHVDPNRALDPGLVYDLGVDDYIGFLCSIDKDDEERISVIVKDQSVDCSTMGLASPGDLNYPSFSVVFKSDSNVVSYRRVVKNVGKSQDVVYEVKVSDSPSVEIAISPSKLVFSAQNQSLSYEITFSSVANQMDDTSPKFAWIEWSDGVHVVRSPIAFTWGKDFVSSI